MTSVLTGRRTAWLVALIPLLFAGALIGLLGEGEHDASPTDSLPRGMDSTLATELRDQLPTDDASVAIVLFSSDQKLSPQALASLEDTATGLGPQVRLVPADDGTAALAVVPIEATSATDNADQVGDLREVVRADLPDGVTAEVTGPAAVEADLAAVFDGANTRLLLVTASVVALLLVLTYRSPFLWLVPLTVVGVADRLAAVVATQVMALTGVAWDESTVGILSVLVFGAGTDYALLLISRYRDELKAHESRHRAMAVAVRRTAEAVLSSATTVVLGLLTLLLSLVPTTRGLGVACAIGVVIAAAFVLVVLPAALVVFGRWVFWPRVPHVGDPALVETRSLWRRVGDRVAARPAVFVTGTLLLLAVMSLGLFRIETGLDQADQFLDEPEAISAAERLAESFPSGTVDPTQVLTRDDADEVLATVTEADGVTGARITQRGNGITQIDAVLGGRPGHGCGGGHGAGPARRPRVVRRHPRRRHRGHHHRRAGGRPARPVGDPAADPRPGAGGTAPAAPLGRGAAAARRHGGGHLRRQPGHLVVGLHPGPRASTRSTWGCRCWRSCSWWRSAWTTTSSWSPGPGRRASSTAPARACCAP